MPRNRLAFFGEKIVFGVGGTDGQSLRGVLGDNGHKHGDKSVHCEGHPIHRTTGVSEGSNTQIQALGRSLLQSDDAALQIPADQGSRSGQKISGEAHMDDAELSRRKWDNTLVSKPKKWSLWRAALYGLLVSVSVIVIDTTVGIAF